jgi:hypothetical protein
MIRKLYLPRYWIQIRCSEKLSFPICLLRLIVKITLFCKLTKEEAAATYK